MLAAGNNCTGTIIDRGSLNGVSRNGLVLTAAHCFCVPPNQPGSTLTGIGPNAGVIISRPATATFTNKASLRVDVWVNSDLVCEGHAVSDLAIVTINGTFSTADVPELPRVYTGADFIFRATDYNIYDPNPFPQAPHLFVGYAPTNQIRRATFPDLRIDVYDFRPFEPFAGYRIRAPQDGYVLPFLEGGDSGGPLTFGGPPGRPTIYGVASYTSPGLTDYSHFTPTWDNRNLNGTWIRSFMSDLDEDGVDDSIDNLPPSMCPSDPFLCANPTQADADNDGVGDERDNCPPSFCTARGLPPGACANPKLIDASGKPYQLDSDGDGTGDVCDSCPYVTNGDIRILAGGQNADIDGDGVGDACDNCALKNAYKACQSTTECASPQGATCIGTGYGKCAGPNGEICQTSADCPFNGTGGNFACNGFGTFGRCDRQIDDPDQDGVGGACDVCPTVATTHQITSNSNRDNELRKAATALGDACEPIPQLVSRGNWGRKKLGTSTYLDPAASQDSYTTFFQTSSLGTGASPTSAQEIADIRHCHCVSASGAEIARAACITGQCLPTDSPLLEAKWRTMTTSTSTTLTAPPTPASSAGQTVTSVFNQTITCNDRFLHIPGGDVCRLGTQRLMRWDHAVDVQRDPTNFPTFTDVLGTHTAGLVLSHVRKTIFTNAARDAIPSLRHTYEYVKTPLVRLVSQSASRTYQNCLLAGCSMVYRPDWVIYPPESHRTQLTPLDDINYYARISLQTEGFMGAVARPADPVFDLTDGISPDILMYMNAPDYSFLTPVESGATARARGDSSRPFAVAMASPWRAANWRPLGVRVFEDGVMWMAFTDLPPPPSSTHPYGHTRFVPADRDGARALYSADELAVFLVGGHRVDTGAATGDVWRYDLQSDTWTSELHDVNTDARPEDPLAVGFDSSGGLLAAIDQVPGASTRRILRIDLKNKTARVVAELPAYSNAGRYSLVHAGNREFLLLRQIQGDNHFDIFRFKLRTTDVAWIGRRTEIGDLLDDAFATPHGVIAPITRELAGDHDFVVIGTTPNSATPASL